MILSACVASGTASAERFVPIEPSQTPILWEKNHRSLFSITDSRTAFQEESEPKPRSVQQLPQYGVQPTTVRTPKGTFFLSSRDRSQNGLCPVQIHPSDTLFRTPGLTSQVERAGVGRRPAKTSPPLPRFPPPKTKVHHGIAGRTNTDSDASRRESDALGHQHERGVARPCAASRPAPSS